jgi:hypothetical protein
MESLLILRRRLIVCLKSIKSKYKLIRKPEKNIKDSFSKSNNHSYHEHSKNNSFVNKPDYSMNRVKDQIIDFK